MLTRSSVAGLTLALALASTPASFAADYHGGYAYHHRHGFHARASIGDCVRTRVLALGPSAGSPDATAPVIRYRDGVIQAYDSDMEGHQETRAGDPIKLCLVAFTRECDEDDFPGRTYATGNLRTGAAWTLPDVRSSCPAR